MSSFENFTVKYINNPNSIYPSQIVFGDKEGIQKVVTAIFKANNFEVANQRVEISILTGGITNVLYLLSFPDVVNPIIDLKVIVRLYGHGTSLIMDRTIENIVFSRLSILGIY